MNFHNPVLLQEVCTYLAIEPGRRYIDGTVGGGGHAIEIVRRGGLVLGLDQDPDALNACPHLDHLTLVQTSFIHLAEVAKAHDFIPVSGILLDLGVSAHQFETPARGFSFQSKGPLDMRMDPSLPNTAADLVNLLNLKQLTMILSDFGEIPVSKSLAIKIINGRPYQSTLDLARVTGIWSRQAFQALRIAVNDELGSLKQVLNQLIPILAPSGRVVIISFHSLEDRLVKQQFQRWAAEGVGEILTPKPITGEKKCKLRAFSKYVKT